MTSLRHTLSALWLLLVFHDAYSVQISMKFGARKCFMEQVPRGATIYAEVRTFSAANPIDIDVFITNERGIVVANKPAITEHKFTIQGTTNNQGKSPFETYRLCFLHQPHPHQVKTPGETRVSFNVRVGGGGVGAQRVELLKRDRMDLTNDKIQTLEQDLNRLLLQMDDLKHQEEILSRYNSATSRHLVTLSSLTSVIIVAIGVMQFDAVKVALRKRKVIP